MQEALQRFGISAFVAHEDIQPTTEWEGEIQRGLGTMEALAAILTPDFSASVWCDQEVGFALGRSRLVIPIRCGMDPYGFLGKYQGLTAQLASTRWAGAEYRQNPDQTRRDCGLNGERRGHGVRSFVRVRND